MGTKNNPVLTAAKPFLKWAGGKRKLVPELLRYAPRGIKGYHEPFVGAGAIFFELSSNLENENPTISDTNSRLIQCYEEIRDHVGEVLETLETLEARHREDPKGTFLETRSRDWRLEEGPYLAASLIYLNKTCFNGLYRVNKDGFFNVPFNHQAKMPKICDVPNLLNVSRLLKQTFIYCEPFQAACQRAEYGNFYYFDPPYLPISATSNFTSYTQDGFRYIDHVDLRDCAIDLLEKGVHVLLSNSAAPAIRELYADEKYFRIHEVNAARSINSDGEGRGKIKEFIIEGIQQ